MSRIPTDLNSAPPLKGEGVDLDRPLRPGLLPDRQAGITPQGHITGTCTQPASERSTMPTRRHNETPGSSREALTLVNTVTRLSGESCR